MKREGLEDVERHAIGVVDEAYDAGYREGHKYGRMASDRDGVYQERDKLRGDVALLEESLLRARSDLDVASTTLQKIANLIQNHDSSA